jgi:hypothetical protein
MNKENKIVKGLINLTINKDIKWDLIKPDDPKYDMDKEMYWSTVQMTKKKSIDILIIKYSPSSFKSPFFNIFSHIYINKRNKNGDIIIHRKIKEIYYQNFSSIYDLFIYAKYYSYCRNDVLNFIFKHIDDFKSIEETSNGIELQLEDDKTRKIKSYLTIRKDMITLYLGKLPILFMTPKDDIFGILKQYLDYLNENK